MMIKVESENKCPFKGCEYLRWKEKRLCRKHLKLQKEKMAEYRVARKKKKLCARCSNPARKLANGKPSTLCQACRDHVRDLERAIVAKRRFSTS